MKDTNKSISHIKKKEPNKYRFALILILVLVIIAAALFIFKSSSGEDTPDPTPSGSGIVNDDNAVYGGWDEADTNEIVASLNKKVDEGMINISMNTSPIFTNGTSTGNLMIVNETINRYPQVVEIVRSDTGETIYKSGAIPVGKKIEEAKLDVDLAKGEYECTAMFYNVNPDTGEYLGCAGAVITVTVLE